MNKKLIIPIVIIIILLAFGTSWYFYKNIYYHNSAIKNSNPSTCLKINNDLKISQCLGKVSSRTGDANICVNSPRMYIMACFSTFAEMNGEIIKCSEVNPDVDEYNCYTAFAQTKRDTSTCDALTGEKKDYCYKSVAISTNDISICNNLPASSVYKETCANDVKYFNP
jgi:hypothetical protein